MRPLAWILFGLVAICLAWLIYVFVNQPSPDGGSLSSGIPPAPTTGSAAPAAPIDDNDPAGLPISRQHRLQILRKPHFTIGYDNDRREPAWVSYALAGPIAFHGKERRPERFADDSEVTASAHHADYTRSGFDRGHLAPAYAMFSRFGPEAMVETFVTSNIIPQVHALNAGRWEDLETLIAGREGRGDGWAGRYGQVWVTDGPVPGHDLGTLPGGEPEPATCFMIILRRDGPGWSALAFEMPNRALSEPVSTFLVSIHRVEEDTGLDFDAALPAEQQAALEQTAAHDVW